MIRSLQRLLALLSDAQTAPFAELPDTGVGLATEIVAVECVYCQPELRDAGEYGVDRAGGRDAADGGAEFRAVWRAFGEVEIAV